MKNTGLVSGNGVGLNTSESRLSYIFGVRPRGADSYLGRFLGSLTVSQLGRGKASLVLAQTTGPPLRPDTIASRPFLALALMPAGGSLPPQGRGRCSLLTVSSLSTSGLGPCKPQELKSTGPQVRRPTPSSRLVPKLLGGFGQGQTPGKQR